MTKTFYVIASQAKYGTVSEIRQQLALCKFVVIQDYSALPGATAAVMAHEIGHNFGFRHDDDSCTCHHSSNNCIMHKKPRSDADVVSLFYIFDKYFYEM